MRTYRMPVADISVLNEARFDFAKTFGRLATICVMHPSDVEKFIHMLHSESRAAIEKNLCFREMKVIRSADCEAGQIILA